MRPAARVGRLAMLTGAMALATVAVGWWGVPIVAAVFAVIDRRVETPLELGAAAGIGWGVLLIIGAIRGDLAGVARGVGGAVGMPASVLFVIALLFPTVLAWSCASVVRLATARRSSTKAESRSP